MSGRGSDVAGSGSVRQRAAVRSASAMVGSVAVVLLVGFAAVPAAGSDDEDSGFQDVEDDVRFETDVDDLDYGSPDGAVDNYTVYVEELEWPDPARWGGGYVDGDELVIAYTGQSLADAEARLAELGIEGSVRLEFSPVSIADYDAAGEQVAGLDGLDGLVGATGPDYVNQRLVVEFLSPEAVSAASTTGALTMFSDPVEYPEVDAPSVADLDLIEQELDVPFVATVMDFVPESTARYNQTTPFVAGGAIRMATTSNTSAALCSSGFAWKVSGDSSQYFLTASHCAATSSKVSRSRVYRYTSTGSVLIGSVAWKSGGFSGTSSGLKGDVAVVKLSSGTSAAQVYHGKNNTNNRVTVTGSRLLPSGWRADSSGETMYTSGGGPRSGNGAGQISPNRVTGTNYAMTYVDSATKSQRFTGLTRAEHGSACVGSGDSGGAVYLKNGSKYYALGVISGNNAADKLPVPVGNCWTLYTPTGSVATQWKGSLKTG